MVAPTKVDDLDRSSTLFRVPGTGCAATLIQQHSGIAGQYMLFLTW